MIKFTELDNPTQVSEKLNEFKNNGWSLGNNYTQIVPTINGKFLLFYDEKLDIK